MQAGNELSDNKQEKVLDDEDPMEVPSDPLLLEQSNFLETNKLTEMNLDDGTQTTESTDDVSLIENEDVSLDDPSSETEGTETDTLKSSDILVEDIRKDLYEKVFLFLQFSVEIL